MDPATDRSGLLKPYVPRLLVDWLAHSADASYRQLEGSLLFLDIAGFTKLSERLARKGRLGAEELVSVLGSTFTQLLVVSYANGGGLIKFGGDALVLWFSGPEHQARAARSAVGMRATLRHIGRLQTSAGSVALRMHVGVHSGPFDFFLVGGSHKELVVCGPATTQTALMESAAEPGEIVVSEATAAALPARAVGPAKGPGRLLRGEPPGPPYLVPDPSTPEDLDLEQGVPVAIRGHVLGGGSDAEHRQVAVAFLHYGGIDALLESSGPEVVGKALDGLMTHVQRVVDRHEIAFLATDIERGGGKIMLTAGAPTSTGNDEERMLRALREIVEGEPTLPIRIGVNRGHVFTGDVGPDYRRTYAVMGDAVNLAARLMAKAEPGQVLASLPVLDRSRTAFETKELEPFLVKGKAHPIRAALVGPVAGTRKVESAELGPLFGRVNELRVLLAALESARGGSGSFVEIVGEPGIGKSRLVEELKARAHDVRTFSLVCDQYESSTPYFPFRLLMRVALGVAAEHPGAGRKLTELVEGLAPHLVPWVPLIAIPLGVNVPSTSQVDQLDEQFRRARLNDAVGDLLVRVLSDPVLVVFEDAHWMDEASGDLLSHLLRGLGERPWMICATRRDQATGLVAPTDRGATSIHLQPLAPEEAAALAWARAEGVRLAPHEIDLLAARSGGNPLFLQELVGGAQAAGGLDSLPESVDALIMARIDRRPPTDRSLLRHAAVLGMAFREDLLLQVLPPDVLAGDGSMWDRLAGFLQRDARGVFRFRHGLIREVAYEGLPYRRRRELHAHAGETIERACMDHPDDEAEILSLHFFNAAVFDKAWRYSRVAGDGARAKYANAEAAVFYLRALQAARRISVPVTELAPIYVSLGDVRWTMGSFSDASSAYAAARRLQRGDPLAEARILLKEARVRYKAGRFSQAVRMVRRAMKTLNGVEGDERDAESAQLAAWYAFIRAVQGRLVEAESWCRRVIEDPAWKSNRDALARTYFVLDLVYLDQGRLQEAVYSQRALSIYEDLEDLNMQAMVLGNMGIAAYFRGRWDEAIELYGRAREVLLRLGDVDSAASATNNIGEIRSDQGRLDEADRLFRDVLRLSRAEGARSLMAFALSNLGRASYRAGRSDEALPLLEEARGLFQEVEEWAQVAEADARIAELHLYRGSWELALAASERTLRSVEGMAEAGTQIPMLHRIRGYALMQVGRVEEAREALAESLRVGRLREAGFEVALTLEALARLAEVAGEEPDPAIRAESRSILDRLGVLPAPDAPLLAGSGVSS